MRKWHGFDACAAVADLVTMSGWRFPSTDQPIVGTGRFGGKALGLSHRNDRSATGFLVLGATFTSGWSGHANLPGAAGTNFQAITSFYDSIAGAEQVTVTITPTGVVSAYRGSSGGTLLGTYTIPNFIPNIFIYIEVGITISATTGSVAVYVEDVLTLNLTNVNTKSTANLTYDQIGFYTGPTFGDLSFTTTLIDDVYFDSVARLHPRRVQTPRAVAASGSPQFTPLASTNVSQINETALDGDTSYNSDGTAGHVDMFTFGSLAANTTIVDGVQVSYACRRDDVTIRQMTSQISSSSVIASGANYSPPPIYGWAFDQYVVDPNTSAAFAVAAVNALAAGYKLAV